MRIFLQQPPIAAEQPRFYQLHLQQDLLGGWVLTREWGQPGARISSKREVFLQREEAEAALDKFRDQQLRKGFRVMFADGAPAPVS